MAVKVLADKNHRLVVVIVSPRAEATRGQIERRLNLAGFPHVVLALPLLTAARSIPDAPRTSI